MEDSNYQSELIKYLNSTFPIESSVPTSEVKSKIASHFWHEYKVNAKNEDDLFLFKYDQSLTTRSEIRFDFRIDLKTLDGT